MKSIMSMQYMMDRVGILLIESFGVVIAIDADDKIEPIEADSNDEIQLDAFRVKLNTLYAQRMQEMERQKALSKKDARKVEEKRKQDEWVSQKMIWLSKLD